MHISAMSTDLGRIITLPKTGDETFHSANMPMACTLKDFWKWSVSDLVSNATRGRLAEFIVAQALEIPAGAVRDEWEAYDLKMPDGLKIQVKSAAYIQSWNQTKFSPITFSIRKSRFWDAATNVLAVEPKHHADVYVFAVLAHKDKQTIDPLNVTQWEFYVMPIKAIEKYERSKVSITLKSLERESGGPVNYSGLAVRVKSFMERIDDTDDGY